MPRVAAEHLSARRQQILHAAEACFSRNGFHKTTMQDIIAETGLSAGAIYNYFKGVGDQQTRMLYLSALRDQDESPFSSRD